MAAYSHHQDAHGPLQRACVSIFRVCLVFAVVWRGNSITMFRYWFGNSMSLYVGGPAYYSTCRANTTSLEYEARQGSNTESFEPR